jgi:hypothetical protein
VAAAFSTNSNVATIKVKIFHLNLHRLAQGEYWYDDKITSTPVLLALNYLTNRANGVHDRRAGGICHEIGQRLKRALAVCALRERENIRSNA